MRNKGNPTLKKVRYNQFYHNNFYVFTVRNKVHAVSNVNKKTPSCNTGF